MSTSIKGIEGMTVQEIKNEVALGGKFVIFQYSISILVMTFKRPTDVFFIKSGDSATKKGIPYTVLSATLGWWGIPWGPIHTIGALYSNLRGGKDVTQDVMNSLS